MKSRILKLAALAAIATLASCANNANSTKNMSRAKFLDEVWVAPALRDKAVSDVYKKVYFAPVSVSNLKKQNWWASQNSRTKEKLAGDARNLANYMSTALNKAANNYPAKRMQVASGPGPDTLVVRCAITELVPAKAFWNAGASAAGFVIPGAGMLSTFGQGSITIEGRLQDGKTGATVASFRNRSTDQVALVNVNSYTWYQGSESNIDDIAAKTAQVLNTPKGTVVSKSSPIKLVAY